MPVVKGDTNICDIPPTIFRELSSLLDTADTRSAFHWRALVAVVPDDTYRDYEIEKFALKIHNGSPAGSLLYDLGSKGYKVRDLIGWLERNQHVRALELIKDHEPLQIIRQPKTEVELTEGEKLTLECEAAGFPYPSYQWIHGETLLPGENERILQIDRVRLDDEGDYICLITNSDQPKGIFTEWVTVEVSKNPNLCFSLPDTKQFETAPWPQGFAARQDFVMPGHTGQASGNRSMCCSIEDNTLLPQYSEESFVQVNPAKEDAPRMPGVATYGPPIIVEQPCLASGQVSLNEPIHLSCRATGGTVEYQWIKDNTLLPDETLPNLSIRRSTLDSAGEYVCVIRNESGEVRTKPVQVKIHVPVVSVSMIPEIYKQPASITVDGPSKALFTCEARGQGVLSYQWYKNGALEQGKCSPRLEVQVSSMDDAAKYQCEVSNEFGKVLSNVVNLVVNFSDAVQYTAQDKVALLIGNQNYRSEASLFAVPTDLQTLTTLLNRLGFKVVTLLDISFEETNNAINTFCELLGEGVYGLFYFVGHGFEHAGQCYLAPCDVKSGFSTPDCVCAEDILSRMQAKRPALSVLLLDICRERNLRADYESPPIFVPTARGNTVIGYASSFSSKAFEDEEGFFMRNLKKVLCRKKPVENVIIDLKRELYNDTAKQGYQQYPELKANLMLPRSLQDPIDIEGFTREFVIRQEKWRCLAGDLLKDPAPMQFTHKALKIRIEIKCLMIFANVMKVFVTVLDPGITSTCEAWLINFPSKISAKLPAKEFNHAGAGKSEITLQDLQKLQEPLRVDLFMRYKTSQNPNIYTKFQHKLPEFDVPLIKHNLCQPLVGALTSHVDGMSLREPSEQDEKDFL